MALRDRERGTVGMRDRQHRGTSAGAPAGQHAIEHACDRLRVRLERRRATGRQCGAACRSQRAGEWRRASTPTPRLPYFPRPRSERTVMASRPRPGPGGGCPAAPGSACAARRGSRRTGTRGPSRSWLAASALLAVRATAVKGPRSRSPVTHDGSWIRPARHKAGPGIKPGHTGNRIAGRRGPRPSSVVIVTNLS